MRRFAMTIGILTIVLAPDAWARCQQQFQCMGPMCWTYLLIEESFDEECPGGGWEDERRFTTSECGTTSSFAMLDTVGGYTQTDHFFQDFYVPGTTGDYAHMELSFGLTNVGPVSDWDVVKIRVSDAITNQVLYDFPVKTAGTSHVCSRFDADISGNHRGKWLRLTFSAHIFQPEVEFHVHWAEVYLLEI